MKLIVNINGCLLSTASQNGRFTLSWYLITLLRIYTPYKQHPTYNLNSSSHLNRYSKYFYQQFMDMYSYNTGESLRLYTVTRTHTSSVIFNLWHSMFELHVQTVVCIRWWYVTLHVAVLVMVTA